MKKGVFRQSEKIDISRLLSASAVGNWWTRTNCIRWPRVRHHEQDEEVKKKGTYIR